MYTKSFKNILAASSVCCGFAAALTGCSDKMDYNEYNVYDKDYISQNFTYVGGFMTDIYNTVDYDFGQNYSGAMLASATDEAEYSKMGNAIEDYYNGAWSPTNAKSATWTNMYKGIKTCNHVLAQFQGLTFDELSLNADYAQQLHRYQNYRWECRFMRAYFYFCLVRQYGGVPLVKEDISAEEANVLPRATSDEVFEYIISECDAIKDSIVADYTDLGSYALGSEETGRADRLAVLALKARAALYWASPLFSSASDGQARYHNAAVYTKQLLDECEARGKGLAASYASLWAQNNYNSSAITKEIIYGRRYYGSADGDHLVEGNNYPVGIEGGSGGNCPTQNLVDAYPMQNGLPISDPASGYDPENPYANRDPRLAATIAVNGDKWPTYTGATAIQTWKGGTNAEPLTGATPTGYYLKKLCNGSISLASSGRVKNSFHTWLTFRLGEFYLNYAEATFKYLGSADATSADLPMSAREAASKTRERVGLPAFDAGLSATEFWQRLCDERFVELAFEGHRFWDVRRWKEADKYFTSITEMKLTRTVTPAASEDEEGVETITYSRQNVSRQWNDRNYLFPIPTTERMKNPNLTQNPDWE